MANKMLFGKSLASYDDNMDNLDDLLSKLTDDEIRELNEDLDPDNSLLPPSQRCRDQTTKAATGPFDREKLIKFLVDKAKSDPDWDEAVPFEKKIRGKVFEKPKDDHISRSELSNLGFDVEFDNSVNAALESATDDELIDLAAILGFTGMMNQVQFHASIENRGQEGGGFGGIAKSQAFKVMPDEPPNMTDIELNRQLEVEIRKSMDQAESSSSQDNTDNCAKIIFYEGVAFQKESITKLSDNDANLTVLNLNNIKTMSVEQISRLCTALGENTHLKELHMAATRLTSPMVEPFLLPLKVNHSLQVLNLESNFITGDLILKLLEAISGNKSAVCDLRLANQRQSLLGVKTEQAITSLVLGNPRITNLGLDFETAEARVRVRDHLKNTVDQNKRLVRVKKA